MKITLYVVGKLKTTYLREGVEDYSGRLQKYCTFALKEIPAEKLPGQLSPAQIASLLRKEGESIKKVFDQDGYRLALDRRGKKLSSEEWAKFLLDRQNEGLRHIQVMVGGPYGLNEDLIKGAHERLSLSSFTLPHELATVVFLEQLYRAHTILKGEPYHK